MQYLAARLHSGNFDTRNNKEQPSSLSQLLNLDPK